MDLWFREVLQDDLDTHTPPKEKVKSYCEDTCEDDQPLFIDILFKDKCDHSGEKTCVTSRVPFEREKLDLSIFSFNEPTNDQSFENITQEPKIDNTLKTSSKMNLTVWMKCFKMIGIPYTSQGES